MSAAVLWEILTAASWTNILLRMVPAWPRGTLMHLPLPYSISWVLSSSKFNIYRLWYVLDWDRTQACQPVGKHSTDRAMCPVYSLIDELRSFYLLQPAWHGIRRRLVWGVSWWRFHGDGSEAVQSLHGEEIGWVTPSRRPMKLIRGQGQSIVYCRTRLDSGGPTAAKIKAKYYPYWWNSL